MRTRPYLLCIFCLLLTLSGSSQDNVRVTVAVTAAGGAPVLDLKKADFSVQDAGKPRAIETFASPQTHAAAPKPAANEYSNAPDVSQSGAIFVVFDTIHTRYIEERNIREMVLKFLGRAAQAKHAVTLAVLSDKGLHVYHDYRTSPDVLLAALMKAGLGGLKGGTPPAGVNDSEVAAEAARLTAFSKGEVSNATPQQQFLIFSLDKPMMMFQNVGGAAYGLPGRKALVWVTNAVPFDIDPRNFQFVSPKESNPGAPVQGAQTGSLKDALTGEQIKHLMPIWRRSVRDLIDGGVAVYPVEAISSLTNRSDAATQARMKTLAELTGGKAFSSTNDPFPEIFQTSNGNVGGYALGFAAEANAPPDFHRVQVTVDKPGDIVSGPEGYFPAEGSLKARAQEDVNLALQSPLEYTGVVFSLKFTGNEDSGGKKKVNMVVSLAGNSGVLNEAARSVDVTIFAVAKDAGNNTVGKLSETAGGQFPPEAVAQIKEMGFQLTRSIEVPAGNYTLHFVIRDNQNGRMGSLVAPLSAK